MLLKEHSGQTVPYSVDGEFKQTTYLTRLDPLSGIVAKISEERAKRSVGICVDLKVESSGDCPFCDYDTTTPERRIQHQCGAVSVPNKYPWEKYDWITIYPPFGTHKVLLSDLYFDDLERLIESSYDLALECSRDPEVIAFVDFTNWGAFAGASQQHPHSQRKSATWFLPPRQEQEFLRCKGIREQYGGNPFDLLAEEERRDGRRVIYDNDVFLAAAFAPTCPHELIAFPKEPISHILQLKDYDRRKLIHPVLGIFPALFFYLGITDLNIAIHMATFGEMEEAREYYRWHMHIYPRRSRLPVDQAGSEIGFGTEIIDVRPEITAEILRRWYQDGPNEGLVAKNEDGLLNPQLIEEFRKCIR